MADLIFYMPNNMEPERRYISEVAFSQFFGLSVQIVPQESSNWCLTDGEGYRRLTMPDTFFRRAKDCWLSPESLPETPLPAWYASADLPEATLVAPVVPVIAGEPDRYSRWFVQEDGQTAWLRLDVLGSAFFMLTRYEEMVMRARDIHDRFPARASFAYREGFLERPIVNEYLEIFWCVLKRIWPGLTRKERIYSVFLSHDVDHPLASLTGGFLRTLRTTAGDLIKRRDFYLGWKRLWAYTQAVRSIFDNDPYNTFDFIMSLSEKHDLQSAFYFFADQTANGLDGGYNLEHSWLRMLLKKIFRRGHEVGLHTSYNTFHDPIQTRKEFQKFLQVVEEEGIRQECWGGRQHYLRWENPTTWQNWDDAGLSYDTTVGFAEQVGFRCGTCYEFPAFNLITRKQLRLRERPLVVMERTLLGEQYMGLSMGEAAEKIVELKEYCKLFRGQFTLLWHNTSLVTNSEKRLYQNVLEKIIK